jgi:hypothetical protein
MVALGQSLWKSLKEFTAREFLLDFLRAGAQTCQAIWSEGKKEGVQSADSPGEPPACPAQQDRDALVGKAAVALLTHGEPPEVACRRIRELLGLFEALL